MVLEIIIILLAFLFTFVICFPYIELLFKFNIRRPIKEELAKLVPGHKLKLGTPIMGGSVILITIMFFSSLYLTSWDYYWLVMIVVCIGGAIGFIDEYINTLGRTFKAIRIARSKSGENRSLVQVRNPFLSVVKKLLLLPWKLFEEALRVSGSTQGQFSSAKKFLLHFVLASIVITYFYYIGIETSIYLPFLRNGIELSYFYYLLILFLILFFEVAFGITDGIDGLSAGSHAISFGIFGIVATMFGQFALATLCFTVVGAELAFLYFNIFPARIEMSDVGTVPLGILFVVVAVILKVELSLLFVGGLFVVEILSSIGQQWSVKLRKKRILSIAPIHHHFEKQGWHPTKVVQRFWLFTFLSGLLGLIVALSSHGYY